MSAPREYDLAYWARTRDEADRRVGFAELDVVAQAAAEQERVLGHDGHVLAQAGQRDVAHVAAVN